MGPTPERRRCWPVDCGELNGVDSPMHTLQPNSHVTNPQSSNSATSRKPAATRVAEWAVAKSAALSSRPWWLVCALVFLFTAMGLGIWAVIAAAKSETDSRKTMAYTSANQKVLNVQAVIESVFNPAFTLAMLINLNSSNWTRVSKMFHTVAQDVYNQTNSRAIYNLQLAPNAFVQTVIPDGAFGGTAIGLDNLRPLRHDDSIKAITAKALTMAGPQLIVVDVYGLVAKYPVFIEGVQMNETFGFGPDPVGTANGLPVYPTSPPPCCSTSCSSLAPGNTTPCCSTPNCSECTAGITPTFARWNACSPLDPAPGMGIFHPNYGNCSASVCYDESQLAKFWGFTIVVVGWEETKDIARLYDLCGQFDFVMTSSGRMPIATCSDTRMIPTASPGILNGTVGKISSGFFREKKPLSITISTLNNNWTLWVVDRRGWTPYWKGPLIAAVVIISLLFTALILLLMASHLQQETLIKEQRASNKKLAQTTAVLEAEKATTDALIMRQLNLISCFASTDVPARVGAPMATTMSRIEAVRVQLSSGQRDTDPVKVISLLGEGSFGKVYKGLWRGTEVAVKTIVLPSNMSGAAKREKMAIMEAAISSSLAHPNVVQTYTYSIRPVRDYTSCAESQDLMDSSAALIQTESIGTYNPNKPTNTQQQQQQPDHEGQIISYEVSLVIEYCDKGCLRDALNAGVFFSHSGLNYKAILDTACDIAKAMVHLHMANVLHSDLKARNVMLKSSGQEGRGVCAKVADFGLSISLDSTQTHASSMFQGTMTHMAPEVLMKGHVSKAADVYAFGITLWELFTAGSAFTDVPGPHLGHAITALKKRPKFSKAAPRAYIDLTEACWSHEPEQRPSFEEVLETLQGMRAELPGPTQRLQLSSNASAAAGPAVLRPYDDRPSPVDAAHARGAVNHLEVAPVVALGLGSTASQGSGHTHSSSMKLLNSSAILVGDAEVGDQVYVAASTWGPIGAGKAGGGGLHGSMQSGLRRTALAGVPEGRESSEG